jgi:hypothetical protein
MLVRLGDAVRTVQVAWDAGRLFTLKLLDQSTGEACGSLASYN